jgi:septum formation protein
MRNDHAPMSAPILHLASSSPRRRDILAALGLRFSAAGVGIDERRLANETPDAMVLRLACAKANAASACGSRLILGADTAVVLDDAVFGKPRDQDDAIDMLMRLSGRTHEVMTGVALLDGSVLQTAISITEVSFRKILPDEAIAYWQSGEPLDKAGAYAIQGQGGAFVVAISGSYSGVVGLPAYETSELLQKAGVDILNTGSPEER